MKRLTINDIAKASLRGGKRAYLSLAIGIFLSIFLVTVMVFAAQGVLLAGDEKNAEQIGYVDFILYDSPEYADSDMLATGMYERLGHAYVTAVLTDTQKYIGWYDSNAEYLFNRRFVEGRMPEKAGEIAVERSALELIGGEAQVGSEVELALTPVDGIEEMRTFTIVGVLTEQTKLFEPTGYSDALIGLVRSFPAILIHESETGFVTGRTVVQRVANVAEESGLYEVGSHWERNSETWGRWFCVYSPERIISWAENPLIADDEKIIALTVVAMFALALLTACGVGISQAMEGVLARRREEIGMLRAVGATRRQIRKIFGRESWLLALVLAPLSVLSGCGMVLVMEKIVPEMIVFKVNIDLIMPILIFSVICILLSARLPLRRASQIMPMSVIRDVELLRKIRSVRSQKWFAPSKIISSRQLKLHPGRQAGAAAMIALMLIMVFFAVGYFIPEMDFDWDPERVAFRMVAPFLPGGSEGSLETVSKVRLTGQDIAQIRALPGVKDVRAKVSMKISMVTDLSGYESYGELPEYLRYIAETWDTNKWLRVEKNDPNIQNELPNFEWYIREITALREAQSVEKDVIELSMRVLTAGDVEALAGNIIQGKLDMDAINSGTQVLVYAPTLYVDVIDRGNGYSIGTYADKEPEKWTEIWKNDLFFAGDKLNLLQLYQFEDERAGGSAYDSYKNAHRVDANPVIGAVLKGEAVAEKYGDQPIIITTEQGAQAMGMYVGAPDINVYLDGDVDAETEAYIADRIERISMRGEGTRFYNQLENYREHLQQQKVVLLTLGSVAFIFLAVAVSMISGSIRRRIHSDTRMIGTLRAVGADKKVLVGCYNGQVLMSVIIGLAAASVLYAVFIIWMESSAWWLDMLPHVPMTLLTMVGFCAVCYGCCRMAMKMSIQSVMNKSIIENIREL